MRLGNLIVKHSVCYNFLWKTNITQVEIIDLFKEKSSFNYQRKIWYFSICFGVL